MDEKEYEKDWPGLPIKYLIIATSNYIVFLDEENDLDWQTSDDFDNLELTQEEKKSFYKALYPQLTVKKLSKYIVSI